MISSFATPQKDVYQINKISTLNLGGNAKSGSIVKKANDK